MLQTKFELIWTTFKDVIDIFFIFGSFTKICWGRVITPLCLKALSPATKKWIFELCTKTEVRKTIFKIFGLDGWLKVSYLLNYHWSPLQDSSTLNTRIHSTSFRSFLALVNSRLFYYPVNIHVQ